MDKKKIQEKARDVAKFTYEVIDDIFGKRILIFAYILAAIFAASVIFQVFTKYIYEEGFSTADALVATILPQNSPFGGASVVQKGKRKMQVVEIKHLHFVGYPEPEPRYCCILRSKLT